MTDKKGKSTKAEEDSEKNVIEIKNSNAQKTRVVEIERKNSKREEESDEESDEVDEEEEKDEENEGDDGDEGNEYGDLVFGEINLKGGPQKRSRDTSLEEVADEMRSKDLKRPKVVKTASELKYDEDALKRDELLIAKKAKMSQRQIIEVFYET
jgi:hypothetical protein